MNLPEVGTRIEAVRGGSLLGSDGEFHPNERYEIQGEGRDTSSLRQPGGVLDASGLWVTPGFVDAHSHLSWSDFDAADRMSDENERTEATDRNRRATLQAGVTTVRDAGGYDPALHRRLAGTPGPRVSLSIDIIGPADARGERHLRDRVARLADGGADWIKVAATGGVGSGDRQLEPVFDPGEFAAVMAAAHRLGMPVMVHAWGGPAVDQALDLGARSIEHAVFLTGPQAARGASVGVYVVPTVWIYTDVLRLALARILPASLVAAARRAVAAHPRAVAHCLAAGVPLAMGTDAGLASQHGRNLHEVAAMIHVGVPAGTALLPATVGGVRLLGDPTAEPFGPGQRADLVVFDRDPRSPLVLRDPRAVVAVVMDGRLVHAAGVHRPGA